MADLNEILTEGMVAIRGMLEGRKGAPSADAACAVAEAMHNLKPNPMMISAAVDGLIQFRETYPDEASQWLPNTFAWVDTLKGAEK